MKDQLVALLEALRLARLEVGCYRDPVCRASAEWTWKRLDRVLNDPAVTLALTALSSHIASPPLVPTRPKHSADTRSLTDASFGTGREY